MTDALTKLVKMSLEFGREDRSWAILGEGNTSTKVSDDQFWIKASGTSLGKASEKSFTLVNLSASLAVVDDPSLSDIEIQEKLKEIQVDPSASLPSVETFVHAVCYANTDYSWIGHCHAVSVLSILASKLGAKPFTQHLYPDAIVVCGRHIAVVPYVDPGLQLAIEVKNNIVNFVEQHRYGPKVILLENHGPFILGKSDIDVLNTMSMLDKWARVILGTFQVSGPNYLNESDADRIENRIDEAYRRKKLLDPNLDRL